MLNLKTLVLLTSLCVVGASAKSGKEVYRLCVGCHGQHGEKPAVGVSKPIKGQKAALTIKQLKAYKAGTLDMHGMGKLMNKYAKRLNENEIKAVAAYIASMR